MSWVPDSGWLRALDLRASTAAALSVECWAALGLAEFDLLYLGVLPAGIRATFVIIALIASLLWLGRLWDIAFGRFKRWRQRRTALAQLDTLSAFEMKLLVDQLAKNEQSFEARLDDTVAAGLRQKGLALRYDTGHPLGWPHTLPDFVWAELRRRWQKQPKALAGRSAARRRQRTQRG